MAEDRDLTLGDRIRKIRMERGMSLAKVAGADFSRAFLNQVELNHSRPSVRVLRVIADRLQAPVDYLLDGTTPALDREIALERARVMLASGKPQECLTHLEPAVDSHEWPLGVDARLCAGAAMLRVGRTEEGVQLLQAQRIAITAHGDNHRMARLEAYLAGGRYRLAGRSHAELADQLLRDGRPGAALEHFREARVLLENDEPTV
ncbi:MAG: helix-turn-helix domain-containing protein [Candidatus Dormibacteraeota bacterium]|nr:helix-turn-helix domain-containing protein [Candidatus Dormibacteraeota bacterium]